MTRVAPWIRILRLAAATCLALLVIAWLSVFRADGESATTREALRAAFDDDIARLVYRWDASDPRPEEARRDALFDFIYETFDSSAWIPQSLFDSNLLTQVVTGSVETIVEDKVGLVPWRENDAVVAYGMAPGAPPDHAGSWTVNCLVCHMAEIDGVAYFGAGNKTFDDKWLGDALKSLTSRRGRLLLPPLSRDHDQAADAYRILTAHHHDKIDSLTRGRSTAFAASYVELYMRPNNGAMPGVDRVGRGDVKTPPLWHTAAKRPSGRWYSDGSFHGEIPLMASSMELEKDRSFDALMTTVMPRIKGQFADVIDHLRPPPYPYPIDRVLAERGKALFHSAEIGCARCHGTYDGNGGVDWPGVHVDVGTDRGRLAIVTAGFVDAFNQSPIAAEGCARSESRLCGNAADRRVGELSVSPQRQRADAASSARARVRAAGDLRGDGGAVVRSPCASDNGCTSIPRSIAWTRPRCAAASAAIATGSRSIVKAPRTWGTTCGRESRQMRIELH